MLTCPKCGAFLNEDFTCPVCQWRYVPQDVKDKLDQPIPSQNNENEYSTSAYVWLGIGLLANVLQFSYYFSGLFNESDITVKDVFFSFGGIISFLLLFKRDIRGVYLFVVIALISTIMALVTLQGATYINPLRALVPLVVLCVYLCLRNKSNISGWKILKNERQRTKKKKKLYYTGIVVTLLGIVCIVLGG